MCFCSKLLPAILYSNETKPQQISGCVGSLQIWHVQEFSGGEVKIFELQKSMKLCIFRL